MGDITVEEMELLEELDNLLRRKNLLREKWEEADETSEQVYVQLQEVYRQFNDAKRRYKKFKYNNSPEKWIIEGGES